VFERLDLVSCETLSAQDGDATAPLDREQECASRGASANMSFRVWLYRERPQDWSTGPTPLKLTGETRLVPEEPFSQQFFLLSVNIYIIWRSFFSCKDLLPNGKIPWCLLSLKPSSVYVTFFFQMNTIRVILS